MNTLHPLPAEALCRRTTEDEFNTVVESTANSNLLLGHQRAEDSLRFGMGMSGDGYNIFVLGQSGSGMLQAVKQMLANDVAGKPPAMDCCYVNNFQNPSKPTLLQLPTGQGMALKSAMSQLMEELKIAIVAAFDSEEHQAKVTELGEEVEARQARELEKIAKEAREKKIGMIQTPAGYGFAPLNKNSEVISPEQYEQLQEHEQQEIQAAIEELQPKLQKLVRKFPLWKKELGQKIRALNEQTAQLAIHHSISALKQDFHGLDCLQQYLSDVETDVIANFADFRPRSPQEMTFAFGESEQSVLRRYEVNTLVDQSSNQCAQVVEENLPTHANLMGRAEHVAHMGTLHTDFTLVKPGALHHANGGYLVLDARQLLMQPLAYDSLKRALKSNEIRIESLENRYGFVSTVSLEPEPIPLALKVVLVGERHLYYLLNAYDPEFPDLFKVSADFDDRIDRNPENATLLANMVTRLANEEQLLSIDGSGLSRIVDQSARMAGDGEKLTTHMRSIDELVRESNYWARQAGRDTIGRADVQKSIDQRIYRADRIRARLYENIHQGTVLIDTDGAQIGQVNALSVLQLGTFTFGQPSRITATVRLGTGNIVDIERETELGGALHSKGVLILSGFLGSRYAQEVPLSLAASLVFEQSYGGVDGDSASLAELCALLSALSKLPIKQCFAMTGSVNQHGKVQAIGGVNEKIEGFYDVCKLRGLVDGQGVVIPASNVRHLMLRNDVVEAVDRGEFKVYAVETVDQAIELLTGVEAGELIGEQFTVNSVNALVQESINRFALARATFASKRESNEHR